MVKLIITDVDDTVVPEGGSTINPEYYDVIRECRKKGIIFGVASGRQRNAVENLFRPVLDEIFILADNGTDISSNDFQIAMKIEDEDYQAMVREVRALDGNYGIMSCAPNVAYFEERDKEYGEHMRAYPYLVTYIEDSAKLTDICKVSVWRKTFIEPEVVKLMQEHWSEKMDVAIAGRNFLDFTSKGCNKGKALSIMQEHYGIGEEETVAFGNADNDISMIKRAKYGYAVGNATENLKNNAFEVIGQMKEDAVLKKIKEIIE